MNRATRLELAHVKPAATSGEPTSVDSKEHDLRELVETELTALVTDETTRRTHQWQRTLDSFKTTLLELEHTCEAAISSSENQALPMAEVSDLVERCVAAAAAERDVAVQRIRLEADTEIRRLQDSVDQSQDLVERLQSELQTERDKLKDALDTIDKEQAARADAEAALQEAHTTSKHVAATLNAQLQAAQVELEAERSESVQLKRQVEATTSELAKLVDALQTVRRAVTFEELSGRTPPQRSDEADPVELSDTPAAPAPATPGPESAETPQPEGQPEADLVAYIDHLLAEIEAIYWRDLESHHTQSTVVERLTANLRYAHAAVVRRGTSMTVASTLFERQLMALMDAKAATSFARHLGISACEYATPSDSPTHSAA